MQVILMLKFLGLGRIRIRVYPTNCFVQKVAVKKFSMILFIDSTLEIIGIVFIIAFKRFVL